MPEAQVSVGIRTMVECGKGMPSTISAETEQFRLEIVPITHSQKRATMKASKAFTWDSPTASTGWISYAPDHWIERAKEIGLGHLMVVVPYAPLICRSRGKSGLFASGHHAIVLCYAMESNIIGMPIGTYRTIISKDYPGPNEERGDELRVFYIPDEYQLPHSSRKDRTIKIIAAFVSEHWAWVINDFSTLFISHVFSRNEYWTPEELSPGTEIWKKLFGCIKKGGPDWVLETLAAKAALEIWRQKILEEYAKQHFQATLNRFFREGVGEETNIVLDVIAANPKRTYTTLFRPIIVEIVLNRFNSFAGLGKYSANDLLHNLAIFPFTPSFIICQDDNMYRNLEEGIFRYLSQFAQPTYLKRGSSVANTNNPFSFNEHLNNEFLSKWVLVYRRSKAVLPISLYNNLLSQGLLDENHIIGEQYNNNNLGLLDPNKRKKILLPVYRCTGIGTHSGYTVIRARLPDSWGLPLQREPMMTDLKEFSFATSVGPSQFRVQVQNRVKYRGIEPGTLAIGRPKSYYTGKAGRPRKGLSKARIERTIKNNTGRIPMEGYVSGDDGDEYISGDENVHLSDEE